MSISISYAKFKMGNWPYLFLVPKQRCSTRYITTYKLIPTGVKRLFEGTILAIYTAHIYMHLLNLNMLRQLLKKNADFLRIY